MAMEDKVILVNENNDVIGSIEKMEAHKRGLLHRAFSVFVFNSRKQLLIHKRAITKYHSGGLWTNTCCSHPREGESIENAAHRRLMEEMGFDCKLVEIFSFVYMAELEDGMKEHELDQVLIGVYDGNPFPDPDEVSACEWKDIYKLQEDIIINPQKYTYWFKASIEKVLNFVCDAKW